MEPDIALSVAIILPSYTTRTPEWQIEKTYIFLFSARSFTF